MTVQFTLRVENEKEVKRIFRRLPGLLRRHLKRAMETSVKYIRGEADDYPPPPEGSSYTRTGTLGRRWTTRVESPVGSVRGILDNPTSYAPYVQGDEDQAWMHVGRWRTIGAIVEKNEKTLLAFFEEELAAAVKEAER